jgi:L-lactate utilization protein LutC
MNFNELATSEQLTTTVHALRANGFLAESVKTSKEAFDKIISMIPAGATVMNGSSQTLEQIGFIEYLKSGAHGWNNVHATIVNEQDPVKKSELRKQALTSEYYLGSVHAVSQAGELVIASASGSQLPHLVFTSQHIILVVSTQKITPTLSDAMTRLEEYVFPLEDQRMKDAGMGGSILSKILLLKREPAFMGRSVTVLFVEEKLGY